jgi:hypothetical protein
MSMFDYIKVDTTLPKLPQSVADAWGKEGVAFQTKDTPNQAMSMYKIDNTGQLWVEKTEGHWVDGEAVAEDASIVDKLSALGHFETDKRWWEEEKYTGAINFYESYNHPEYHIEHSLHNDNKFLRFEYGWIEYSSLFQNGKLIGDITLVEHTEPKKLSDEEYEERIAQRKKRKEENETSFKENRKKYPSVEQKLIDNIDRECKLTESIMDETDLNYALSNIVILIKEYRKKYDIWYEEVK